MVIELKDERAFENQPWDRLRSVFKDRVRNVRNFREVSDFRLSDSLYMTFGTDAICVIYTEGNITYIKRVFNFYDMSIADFLKKLDEVQWEILE